MRNTTSAAPDAAADVVIIGGSLAAVSTALALRSERYAGSILVVGDEPHPPYDRPPLSKQFLDGSADAAAPTLLTADRAREAGIGLMLGRTARGLHPASKRVLLNGGGIRYRTLVIATGAHPRELPGAPEGVHKLRSLDDAVRLRQSLRGAARLAIIGAGLIGSEVASAASAGGIAVTLIDVAAAPLSPLLGPEVSELLARRYRERGVTTRFGAAVTRLTGGAGDMTIALADGTEVRADTVLAAIGVRPNTGWLAGSAVDTADGVACDEFGRVTGQADLYAVGDVARWHQPGTGRSVRFEDWTSVHQQAVAVAHNIAAPADPRPLSAARYGWTDQFGLHIQLAGEPAAGTVRPVFVNAADPASLLVTTAGDDGVLTGAVTVGWPRAMAECRRAIRQNLPAAETAGRVPNAVRLEVAIAGPAAPDFLIRESA